MKIIKNITLAVFIIAAFGACKKTAGEGGSSKITGTVWLQNWNSTYTVLEGEYPATDQDVYIIYGDHVSYDDKVKTNYNGQYEFRYLREGNYKIYVFSKDNTLQSPSGEMAVIKDVKITDTDQTVKVDTITIYK
jgi:hypothetical protein